MSHNSIAGFNRCAPSSPSGAMTPASAGTSSAMRTSSAFSPITQAFHRVFGENALDVRIAEDVPALAGVIAPDGLLGAHLLKPAILLCDILQGARRLLHRMRPLPKA